MDIETTLSKLTSHAQERLAAGQFGLMGHDGYVRVSAGGFRAVCVSADAPLCQFGARTVSSIRSLEGEFEHARPPSATAADKPERLLQAHIIRGALSNDLDLVQVFRPGRLPFEKLLFALDEVRLERSHGDVIRCDLLAVAIDGKRREPAVIELKWGRQLTRLDHQLRAFSGCILEYRESFEKLLGTAVGLAGVSARRVHHLVVWPPPRPARPETADGRSGPDHTRERLRDLNISALMYERTNGGYRFDVEALAPRPAVELGA